MNITRHQLIGFGCTKHQATALTKALAIAGKQKRSNLYRIANVLQAITVHLARAHIRKATQLALKVVQDVLVSLTANVVSLPFSASHTPATDAVKHLLKTAFNPKTLKHKMQAAELKGKQLTHAK